MQLTKGGNAPLKDRSVNLRLSFDKQPAGADIDVSAYLLRADGKVRGDADMVFFNQPSAVGIQLQNGNAFSIGTQELPSDVEKIAICVVVDGRPASALGAIQMSTSDGISFRHDVSDAPEAAIILAEVYRRNGEWKIRAVGQGFTGGMAPLARSFGIDVNEEPVVQAPPPPAPVSLKKVTLKKEGKVSLKKGGGEIRARLIWEGRYDGDGDLDFYCFYVMKDGRRGKVYWNNHGSRDRAPFITLSGDSQAAGMEEIVLHRPEEIRFALLAAYSALSNGTGSFQSYRPKVVLTDHAGNEVTIPLLNPNEFSYWVAISHIAVADEISISHVETYGVSGAMFSSNPPGTDAEAAPRLHPDGRFDVSLGEVEFKD
ncbi:TerD family protein [Sphingomonas sp. 3-13AW]|uniref:TerD family protein n=1 Tax=Sphingomonas sp. 3-13AW TaxID=3050450 RepID=UPI003BB5468F